MTVPKSASVPVVLLLIVSFALTISVAQRQPRSGGDVGNRGRGGTIAVDRVPGQDASKRPQYPKIDKRTVTFKSESKLVLVPVVVTDKKGQHIVGLNSDSFTVLEDGKTQRVTIFEEVKRASGAPIARPTLPPGFFTNTVITDNAPRQINIVVLDLLNTPFADQARARDELVKFLARTVNIESPTSLVVLGRKGLRVLHDFTSNPGLLVAALRAAGTEVNQGHVPPPASVLTSVQEMLPVGDVVADPRSMFQAIEYMAASADVPYKQAAAIQQTMEAFQHLAQSFAGISGRKAVIWATAAFPFHVTEDSGIVGQGQPSSLYERTMQMLNHANIAIYPVDVRGLVYFSPSQMELTTQSSSATGPIGLAAAQQTVSPSSRLGGTAGPSDYHGPTQAATIGTMEMFASMTGGRAFYNRNDLDTSFEEAAKDSVSYYLLGYQLDTSNKRSGWRKLKVELKQEGARVRARNGFFVTPVTEDPKYSRDVDIFNALESPLDYTVVPFSVRWLEVKPSGGRLTAKFLITISPSAVTIDATDDNKVEIEIVGVTRNAKGESVGEPFSATIKANLSPEQLAQVKRGGVVYREEISVPAGNYNVRFVVRDNLSGRTGSLLARLGNPEAAMK